MGIYKPKILKNKNKKVAYASPFLPFYSFGKYPFIFYSGTLKFLKKFAPNKMSGRLGNSIIFSLLIKHAFCSEVFTSSFESLTGVSKFLFDGIIKFLSEANFKELNERYGLSASFANNGLLASIFDFRIFPAFFACALIVYVLICYFLYYETFSRTKKNFVKMVPVFYSLIFIQILGSLCLLALGGPTLYFAFGNYCTGISFTHVVSLAVEVFFIFFVNFLRKRFSKTIKVSHDYKAQEKFVLETLSTGSQITTVLIAINQTLVTLIIAPLSKFIASYFFSSPDFDMAKLLWDIPVFNWIKPLAFSPPYNIRALVSKSFLSFLTSDGAVGQLGWINPIVGAIESAFSNAFISNAFYLAFMFLVGKFIISIMSNYIIPYASKNLRHFFNLRSNNITYGPADLF